MATIPIPFQLRRRHPRPIVDAQRVIMLRAQGLSWRAISRKLGVGTGRAFRAVQGCTKIVSKSFTIRTLVSKGRRWDSTNTPALRGYVHFERNPARSQRARSRHRGFEQVLYRREQGQPLRFRFDLVNP
jgi:hypothetical protein